MKGLSERGFMKSKKQYLFTGLLIVMVSAGACGQAAPAVPTIDTSARATSLAGTAVAAFGTATPIPSPTETPVPTPRISSAGTSLLSLADGSTQFTDHAAGFQMLFSSIWLVFRVGEPEYYAAWEKPEMQAPEFQNMFTSLQSLDPKNLRVIALDVRPDHRPNGTITGISVVSLPGQMTSLEEWERTRKNRKNPCVGFKFIASSYQQTINGIRILVTEESCSGETGKGTVYDRDVYFGLSTGTIHLNMETNFDTRDVPLLEFEQMVNGLTLLNP